VSVTDFDHPLVLVLFEHDGEVIMSRPMTHVPRKEDAVIIPRTVDGQEDALMYRVRNVCWDLMEGSVVVTIR
jgi:hypothetical protein